jgi:hypothetical protein
VRFIEGALGYGGLDDAAALSEFGGAGLREVVFSGGGFAFGPGPGRVSRDSKGDGHGARCSVGCFAETAGCVVEEQSIDSERRSDEAYMLLQRV